MSEKLQLHMVMCTIMNLSCPACGGSLSVIHRDKTWERKCHSCGFSVTKEQEEKARQKIWPEAGDRKAITDEAVEVFKKFMVVNLDQ